MDENVTRYLQTIAKKGGNTTLAKYGTKHFSEAGRKGALTRKGKKRGTYNKRKQKTESAS